MEFTDAEGTPNGDARGCPHMAQSEAASYVWKSNKEMFEKTALLIFVLLNNETPNGQENVIVAKTGGSADC
jgi:hypothetical protein